MEVAMTTMMMMMRSTLFAAVVMALPSPVLAQLPGEPKAPPSYDVTGDAIHRFKRGAPDETVREAQRRLRDQGYYQGPVDGLMTPQMRRAVWNFQASQDLRRSGSLDPATMAALERGASGTARGGVPSGNGADPGALPRDVESEPTEPARAPAPTPRDVQAP
jgi:peptidoglycan hydrolase-like protein with peptidoglycan-binding domain